MGPVDDKVFHIDNIQFSQLNENYLGFGQDRTQTQFVEESYGSVGGPMSGSTVQYQNRRKYTPQVHADYQ